MFNKKFISREAMIGIQRICGCQVWTVDLPGGGAFCPYPPGKATWVDLK